MELHSLWTFYYETVLNSQILLANPLWNGFVHCDLQCAFWNWSKYTSAGRKRFTTALPLYVIAHYITRPQDTSIHFKNFTDTTIQMKLPLWNRSRVSLWVSEENSKMQLHYNKFIITGYLVNRYYLSCLLIKNTAIKEGNSITITSHAIYLLFVFGKSDYESVRESKDFILPNIWPLWIFCSLSFLIFLPPGYMWFPLLHDVQFCFTVTITVYNISF